MRRDYLGEIKSNLFNDGSARRVLAREREEGEGVVTGKESRSDCEDGGFMIRGKGIKEGKKKKKGCWS